MIDLGETEVQDVSELVEEGDDLVVFEERRRTGSGFGEIRNDSGDRRAIAAVVLSHTSRYRETGGVAELAFPGEEVGVEVSDRLL